MRALLIAAFLCVGSKAFAALPPLYQGKREVEAILSSPEFGQKLSSGEVLQEIKRTPTGYLIITNHHVLTVLVHYNTEREVGPAKFTLEFKEPIDLASEK